MVVAPKLVGVENVAVAEEILKELRDQMLDELDAIERELGGSAPQSSLAANLSLKSCRYFRQRRF